MPCQMCFFYGVPDRVSALRRLPAAHLFCYRQGFLRVRSVVDVFTQGNGFGLFGIDISDRDLSVNTFSPGTVASNVVGCRTHLGDHDAEQVKL